MNNEWSFSTTACDVHLLLSSQRDMYLLLIFSLYALCYVSVGLSNDL